MSCVSLLGRSLGRRFSTLLRSLAAAAALLGVQANGRADIIADFDDLSLAPESAFIGPDPSGTDVIGPFGTTVTVGSFQSRGVSFVNRYDNDFALFSGFAYSNQSDNTTQSFLNQTSAITGSGRGAGADNYGVAFGYDDLAANLADPEPFDPTNADHLNDLPYLDVPLGHIVSGMYVTNTTYAALTMENGDPNGFAKQFGGATGNDADFFKLTAYGTDALGIPLLASVEFLLADFTFSDNALDFIVKTWEFMDLSSLAGARRIHFNLSSSDVGIFGMNTPAFFAVDDIEFVETTRQVPEPGTFTLAALGGLVGGVWRLRRRAGVRA